MSLPTLPIRPSVSTDLYAMRDNPGSIGVRRALGFERSGPLPVADWKLRQWRDAALMQLTLDTGVCHLPAGGAP